MWYDDSCLVQRARAVAQAVANMRARGVEPNPAVLALYVRYAQGELSHEQVRARLQRRAQARADASQTATAKREG